MVLEYQRNKSDGRDGYWFRIFKIIAIHVLFSFEKRLVNLGAWVLDTPAIRLWQFGNYYVQRSIQMSLRNPVTNLRWLNSDHQKRINAIFFLIVCFLAAFFAKLCNSQESSETTSGVKYNTEFFPEIPDTSRCAVLDGSDSVSLHWEISNNFPFAIKLAGTSTGCSCTSVSVGCDRLFG